MDEPGDGTDQSDQADGGLAVLRSGLVSVTFRKLAVDEVLALAVEAGIEGIEWGGDVHVPPGDADAARGVGDRTREAGLEVYAYGSYFRPGVTEGRKHEFAEVLETAVALGTDCIRVWAGNMDSEDAPPALWETTVAELKSACRAAANVGITIGMEFHSRTLNNRSEGTTRLIESVAEPNLATFWQVTNGAPDPISLRSLRAVRDYLAHVHVFNWGVGPGDQLSLAEGEERWAEFLAELRTISGERFLGLEFVKGGTEDQFRDDAVTLKRWLAV